MLLHTFKCIENNLTCQTQYVIVISFFTLLFAILLTAAEDDLVK